MALVIYLKRPIIFRITEKDIYTIIVSITIMENKKITTIIKHPTKKGDQYYFSIPIEFIRSKKIDPKKDYEIQIFSLSQD